jgi:hypothetical protein
LIKHATVRNASEITLASIAWRALLIGGTITDLIACPHF